MSIQLDPKYDERPKDRHNSFDIERLRYSGLRACIEYRSLYRRPRHVKVRLIKGSAMFHYVSLRRHHPIFFAAVLQMLVIMCHFRKLNEHNITSDLLYLSR